MESDLQHLSKSISEPIKGIQKPLKKVWHTVRFWLDIFISLTMFGFLVYLCIVMGDFLNQEDPKHKGDYMVLFVTLAITLGVSCGYYAYHAFMRTHNPHAKKTMVELILQALGRNVLLIVCLVVVPFLVAILGEQTPLNENLENLFVRLGLYSGLVQVFIYIKDNVEENLRLQRDEDEIANNKHAIKHLR